MKPLRVRVSRWERVLLGVFSLCLLNGAFGAWFGFRDLLFTVICLVGANLLLVPFLMFGPIEMNDQYIAVTLPHGRFEVAWDEVQTIEKSTYESGAIVFHCQHKKLVIPASGDWIGPDKTAMAALFNAEVEKRHIPTIESFFADWQLSRGARVKEF